MQANELAGEHELPGAAGIEDCLWVIGEPISAFKEAVKREALRAEWRRYTEELELADGPA
jgi:hypothetical protein